MNRNIKIPSGKYAGNRLSDVFNIIDENDDWQYIKWCANSVHRFPKSHWMHTLLEKYNEIADNFDTGLDLQTVRKVSKPQPKREKKDDCDITAVVAALGDRLASITFESGKVELRLKD